MRYLCSVLLLSWRLGGVVFTTEEDSFDIAVPGVGSKLAVLVVEVLAAREFCLGSFDDGEVRGDA